MVKRKITLSREQQAEVNSLDWIALTLAHRAVSTKHIGDAASLEDIIQVARMGICMAVYDFKPDKGMKLSTYAWTRAYAYIGHFFRDKTRMIRVPREEQTLYYRVLDLKEKNPDWGVKQLAKALNLKEEKILSLVKIGTMEPGPLFEETAESLSSREDLESNFSSDIYYKFGSLFTDREINLLLRYYSEKDFKPTARQSSQIDKLLARALTHIEENSLSVDSLV